MNRNDWEKQVFNSDLNSTARIVAVVAGSFGNWTDDRNVWPSTKAIADMAGMHRDTAQKYMDAFVEQGWLRVVKVRPGNIREYELCQADAYPLGILAKPTRTGNLPNRQATDLSEPDIQLPNHQASSCLTEQEQLPNGAVPVAYPLGTNLKEPTNKNLEELETTPAAPVVPIREAGEVLPTSPNVEKGDEVLYPMSGPAKKDFDHLLSNTYRSASETQKAEAKRIIEGKPGTGDFYEDVRNAFRATGMEIEDVW